MKNKKLLFGLIVILVVSGLLSLFASGFPDGLEYVAEKLGFINTAQDASLQIIPDYVFPGIANQSLATSIAGIVGALGVFGMLFLLGKKLYQPHLD